MKKKLIIIFCFMFLVSGCGFNNRVVSLSGEDLKETSQYVVRGHLNKVIYYQEYRPPYGAIASYEYKTVYGADLDSFKILNFKAVNMEYMKKIMH